MNDSEGSAVALLDAPDVVRAIESQDVAITRDTLESKSKYFAGSETSEKPMLAKLLQFHVLAGIWKQDTSMLSLSSEKYEHPAYLQILSLGPDIVTALLEDLLKTHDDWFDALSRLTGEDPIPPQDYGFISRMAGHWELWGRRKRLLR
jgi:hypothetical protein